MKDASTSKNLTTLAGVIAALSMTSSNLWFVAPVAMALFFYVLLFKTEKKSTALINGLIFGLFTGGAGVWWFWHALPLGWIAPTSFMTQWVVLLITWLMTSFALAVPTIIFSYIVWKFKKYNFVPAILIFGWALQELGREISFALYTLAPQSVLTPHFSSANIGYTLANNNYLLQLAEGVGVYNLSMTVALMGATIAFVIHSQKSITTKALIMTLLIVLITPIFISESEEKSETSLNFALLTTYVPSSSKDDVSHTYEAQLKELSERDVYPDVIVFPEGSGLARMSLNIDRKELLQTYFGDSEILVLSSDYVDYENGHQYSVLSYDSSTEGTIETYEKIFLMPQGEYMPSFLSIILQTLQNNHVDGYIDNLLPSLKRGTETKAVEFKGAKIGALLCSEGLSPRLYRDMVKNKGANVLVNLSRSSWFHGSRLLHNKIVEIGKVHAVQNNSYYIQASNGSPSYVINSDGELISQTKWDETIILDVVVPVRNK